MKQLFDISSDVSFYITLAFIFLINFSIAGCHILFTLLCIQLIVYVAKNKRKAFAPSIESGDGGQGTSQEGTTTLAALPKYYKYFLLYILFSFISALFAIDRLVSLKDNKEFFVFLLIPILMLVLNTRKRLLLSLYTILCSSLLSALIGIIDTLRHGISLDHRLKGL
ncbi:MAG: hypothetical protein GY765_11535, partial [bacterium]|nr:hypothetical protein [bacterium]